MLTEDFFNKRKELQGGRLPQDTGKEHGCCATETRSIQIFPPTWQPVQLCQSFTAKQVWEKLQKHHGAVGKHQTWAKSLVYKRSPALARSGLNIS